MNQTLDERIVADLVAYGETPPEGMPNRPPLMTFYIAESQALVCLPPDLPPHTVAAALLTDCPPDVAAIVIGISVLAETWMCEPDGTQRSPSERVEAGDPSVKTAITALAVSADGVGYWCSVESVDDAGVSSFPVPDKATNIEVSAEMAPFVGMALKVVGDGSSGA